MKKRHTFIPFMFDTFGFLAPDVVGLLNRDVVELLNSLIGHA